VVHVFVRVTDPSVVREVASLHGALDHASRKQIVDYLSSQRKTLMRPVDVTGTVRTLTTESGERTSLMFVADNVDPTFTIVDQGGRPSNSVTLFMLLLGVAAAFLTFLWWMNARAAARVQSAGVVISTTTEAAPGTPATAQTSGFAPSSFQSSGPFSPSDRPSTGPRPVSGVNPGSGRQPDSSRQSGSSFRREEYPQPGQYLQSGPFGSGPTTGPRPGSGIRPPSGRQPASASQRDQFPQPGQYLAAGPFGAEPYNQSSPPRPPTAAPPQPPAEDDGAAKPESFPPAFDPFADPDKP
jgi:hypothetical protein